MSFEHHFETNRANWDSRAPLHASRSSGYKTQSFIDDKLLLSNTVKFDIPRLQDKDIRGKRAIHLQCHIGTDTISLARRGAINVVGLDFSSESVKAATALVAETGDKVRFVEANVYDACDHLPESQFDLVFTGIGAICWLPDIDRWAEVVNYLLAPGGILFIREGHPVLWAVDETIDDGPTIRFPYFNVREPLEMNEATTYVDTGGEKVKSAKTFSWNHGLAEVITALLKQGLALELFEEHDSVPWEAMPGYMFEREPDEWALKERQSSMPLTYTVVARKSRAT